jgi:glycerol-3-phosphate dehydrogenase
MGLALTANDFLSLDRNRLSDPEKELHGGMIISQRELSRILPGYDLWRATGAAVWYDAQIYNSERLLLGLVHSAGESGAQVANYVEAISLLQKGDRIIGVQAKDCQTGQTFHIQSKVVINCAGAWVDQLLGKIHLDSAHATSIAMNVFVDQVWSGVAAGLHSEPSDGTRSQVLFVVPWRDKSMIGTWHLPWHAEPQAFKLTEAAVQHFLDQINTTGLPCKYSMKDIRHIAWGFLPVSQADVHTKPVKLTRDGVIIDHQKTDNVSGLISLLGVKYTTARAVAEQAVDLAKNKLGIRTRKCETQMTPIQGGKINDFRSFVKQARATKHPAVDEKIIDHLTYTYGLQYKHLVAYMTKQPDLMQRMDSQLPVTAAEVIHAVQQEMALRLPDVIQRRTELCDTGLPALPTLQKCADLMGYELGWTAQRQQKEIDSVIQAYPIQETGIITA